MKKILLILAILTVAGVGADAQTLVTYDFTGATGSQASQPAGTFDADLTASGITRGSGVTASANADSISSTGWSVGAIDLNDYYTFTLTPKAGVTMDVGTLTFGEARSSTGIRDFAIRTSLDSFAVDVFLVNVPDNTSNRSQSFAFGSAFDAITSALEIRIYGFNAEGASGSWRLQNTTGPGADNMQLTGTAVIPEPVTCALFGAGALLWVLRRKRAA